MILCSLYGKGLEPFSLNGVAGMLFCPQCAKNCTRLLANGQGLHLDAVTVERAMDEARSGFVKTTEIVNKILEERESHPWDFSAGCLHSCCKANKEVGK